MIIFMPRPKAATNAATSTRTRTSSFVQAALFFLAVVVTCCIIVDFDSGSEKATTAVMIDRGGGLALTSLEVDGATNVEDTGGDITKNADATRDYATDNATDDATTFFGIFTALLTAFSASASAIVVATATAVICSVVTFLVIAMPWSRTIAPSLASSSRRLRNSRRFRHPILRSALLLLFLGAPSKNGEMSTHSSSTTFFFAAAMGTPPPPPPAILRTDADAFVDKITDHFQSLTDASILSSPIPLVGKSVVQILTENPPDQLVSLSEMFDLPSTSNFSLVLPPPSHWRPSQLVFLTNSKPASPEESSKISSTLKFLPPRLSLPSISMPPPP